MQQGNTPQNAGKVAFQWGLIFGLILGLVDAGILLMNAFVNSASGNAVLALLFSVLGFLLGLAAYFVAGILASNKTGKVSTGTFAGLWTGAIYGVIGFVVSMTLFFTVSLPKLQNTSAYPSSSSLSPDTLRTTAIFAGVGFAIFGICLAVGLGAGLGSLGGLIGKSTSKVAAAPTYPPYANQPPYPGQPYPYPGQPNPTYPNQNPPYPHQAYAPQTNPDQPNAGSSEPNSSNPYEPDPGQSYFEQPH